MNIWRKKKLTHRIGKTEDGRFGIYSTVVDDYIIIRPTLEELKEAYKVIRLQDFHREFERVWENMAKWSKVV